LKKLIIVFLLIIPLLLLPLPNPSNPELKEKIKVVATISIIADIVKNVGKDRVEVTSIVPVGGDPHIYEPTPSDPLALEKADIVFYAGLGLEKWLNKLVENVKGKVPIVKLSEGINFRIDERTGEPDPHVWMDPSYVILWTKRISEALSTIDPVHSEDYKRNEENYIKELKDLDDWIKKEVSLLPLEKRKLITTHDAFRYFGDRYGFKVVGTVWGITTDEEPSAQLVAKLIEIIKREGVSAVFVESTVNPQILKSIVNQTGVKLGEKLYSDSLGVKGSSADTYIGMMKSNVKSIVSALMDERGKLKGENSFTLEERNSSTLLDYLLYPFNYEFMRRALLLALIIGVVGGVVGSYAILRGWALLGDALSHSVLPGISLAYLLGLDLFLGALGAGLAASLGIGIIERRTKIKRDAIMGIVFTGAFALGLAMISIIKSVAVDLFHILFGNILAVTLEEVILTISLGIVTLITVLIFYRPLMIYSFDPVLANSLGLRTRLLHYLLMTLMTLAIVSALKSVGIVLVVAMLITPASAAYLISKRLKDMMFKAAIIGVLSSVIGLYLSFYFNISSGPSIVIVSTLIFLITLLYKKSI